jgi:hypothetical protein
MRQCLQISNQPARPLRIDYMLWKLHRQQHLSKHMLIAAPLVVLLFHAGEVGVEVGVGVEEGRVVEVLSGVGEVEGEVVDYAVREDDADVWQQVSHQVQRAPAQEVHVYWNIIQAITHSSTICTIVCNYR